MTLGRLYVKNQMVVLCTKVCFDFCIVVDKTVNCEGIKCKIEDILKPIQR